MTKEGLIEQLEIWTQICYRLCVMANEELQNKDRSELETALRLLECYKVISDSSSLFMQSLIIQYIKDNDLKNGVSHEDIEEIETKAREDIEGIEIKANKDIFIERLRMRLDKEV